MLLMDLYVLAPNRTSKLVESFLNHFLPARERTAVDFPVPHHTDQPDVVLGTPEDAVDYCCSHPNATQSIYWLNAQNDEPQSAHVFFLDDGGLVLGLSLRGGDFDEGQPPWHFALDEMKQFVGSEYGYCVAECPPESSVEEFQKRSREYQLNSSS